MNDILDMEQIKQGYYHQIRRDFDPNEVISLVVEIFQMELKTKKLEIEVELRGIINAEGRKNEIASGLGL